MAIIKGFLGLVEAPDSPQETRDAGGITTVIKFGGTWAAVVDNTPLPGNLVGPYKKSGFVEAYTRQKLPGEFGTISVTLRLELSGDTSTPTDYQPVYQVEWEEVDLPLSHNYQYRGLFYDADGKPLAITVPGEISFDGLVSVTSTQPGDIGMLNALIQQSKSINNPKAYKSWDAWVDAHPPGGAGGADKAKEYIHSIWSDSDMFQYHAPVATITTRSTSLPLSNPCDRYRTTKPFTGCPDGYIWMRCDDRGTRTGKFGKWDRVIAYRGYEMIIKSRYKPE